MPTKRKSTTAKSKPAPVTPPAATVRAFHTYRIVRTDEEIDNQLNDAAAWENNGGSSVPGMSYEQGCAAMFNWLTGTEDERPIQTVPDEDEDE